MLRNKALPLNLPLLYIEVDIASWQREPTFRSLFGVYIKCLDPCFRLLDCHVPHWYMLSLLTWTHFLPDDSSAPCTFECSERAFENGPYCLSVRMPTVHPKPCLSGPNRTLRVIPYASRGWLELIFFYFIFSLNRGIQHQHSGEASSHHRLSGSWLGLPYSCGCYHHCLQPVSRLCLAPL